MDLYTLVLVAIMVCREAAFEPTQAKLAIAQTVVNRADNPGWWGTTPEEVVLRPYQYSPMTDPRDPQLTYWPTSRGPVLKECLEVSKDALTRKSSMVVNGADSFYSDTMAVAPTWATPKTFVAKHGHHFFHDLDGR